MHSEARNDMAKKYFQKISHYCVTAKYPNIPFRARSCGHFMLASNYNAPPLRREFVELFWCLGGEGRLVINNRSYPLRPGEVCFYISGDVHQVSCGGDFFHSRWVTFEGPAAMEIWKGIRIPQTPRQVGRCPEELFVQLEEEILNYSSDGLRLASATAFRILMLAASRTAAMLPIHDYVEQAQRVIDTQYRNPNLNIGGIADRLGINRSQLSRKFHAVYGVTPAKYLINRRIQYGLQKLTNSPHQIKEIAASSGFSDPNYFTKVIKKYMGMNHAPRRS